MRAGHAPAVRITPLTDRDIHEIVAATRLGSEVEELLGRISQMIEELPWLSSMEAEIHRVEPAPGQCQVFLGPSIKLGFCK